MSRNPVGVIEDEPYVVNHDCSNTSFDYMYRIMTMPRYLDLPNDPAPNSAEDTKKNFATSNVPV